MFMTKHKFIDDLEALENNPLIGNFLLLVVGTFNADINDNNALWFYGRPENEFWCFLPRMMNNPTLHPVDRNESLKELSDIWRKYCENNKIIIVDLFKSVEKDLVNHSDKELKSLNKNEYKLFDYKKAFEKANFNAVLFTWKGINGNDELNCAQCQGQNLF